MTNIGLLELFDKGKIKESILGDNEYFIPEPTYRNEHDIIYVLHELIVWSERKRNQERVTSEIKQLLDHLLFSKRYLKLLDLILAISVEYDYLSDKTRWYTLKTHSSSLFDKVEYDTLTADYKDKYSYLKDRYINK